MPVTEQDAIAAEWCPMIRIRREIESLRVQPLQSRPPRPLQEHAVPEIFSGSSRISADIAKRFRFRPICVFSWPKKDPDLTA
jgi:hypothetical protein